MRVVTYISVLAMVFSVVVLSHTRISSVRAQAVQPPPCGNTTTISPSPGRYTGSWHSDGDYHFAVFNTDLNLKIIIDGTLDLTVGADGRLSGTATGTVSAPIYHDGIHDVSSGTGTISGIVSGTTSTPGSVLVLTAPVIAMQWGTFIGGGYTVPRSITMPNYQLALTGSDCISSGGSIAEQNFPVQYVVADGASGLTQAPGIGSATGSWSVRNVDSSTFDSLTQNIEGFISTANAALAGNTPITPSAAESTIVQPLTVLLQSIAAHPGLSGCLLRRLNAWISSVAPSVDARVVQSLIPGDPPAFRQAFDLLGLVRAMGQSCSVPDGGAAGALSAAETTALDRAIAQRQWAVAALILREIELGNPQGSGLAAHTFADFNALVRSAVPAADLVDVARMAYAWGDETDARAALAEMHPGTTFTPLRATTPTKKHKKKKTKPAAPVVKSTPTPSPVPSPTPHPTASVVTTLKGGLAPLTVRESGGAMPTFSWDPVPGAVQYVVAVITDQPSILWSWSGTATSIQYGDTVLPGITGSSGELWAVPVPAGGASWSVLAIDAKGKIIGAAFRMGF